MNDPVPTRVERLEDENERLRELLTTLALYTSAHTWKQLTTEQKELYADVLDDEAGRINAEEELTGESAHRPTERWWRDGERRVPPILTLLGAGGNRERLALIRETTSALTTAGLEGTTTSREVVAAVAVNTVLTSCHLERARDEHSAGER